MAKVVPTPFDSAPVFARKEWFGWTTAGNGLVQNCQPGHPAAAVSSSIVSMQTISIPVYSDHCFLGRLLCAGWSSSCRAWVFSTLHCLPNLGIKALPTVGHVLYSGVVLLTPVGLVKCSKSKISRKHDYI